MTLNSHVNWCSFFKISCTTQMVKMYQSMHGIFTKKNTPKPDCAIVKSFRSSWGPSILIDPDKSDCLTRFRTIWDVGTNKSQRGDPMIQNDTVILNDTVIYLQTFDISAVEGLIVWQWILIVWWSDFVERIPSGNWHGNGRCAFWRCIPDWKWGFSIAMLVYWNVNSNKLTFHQGWSVLGSLGPPFPFPPPHSFARPGKNQSPPMCLPASANSPSDSPSEVVISWYRLDRHHLSSSKISRIQNRTPSRL